MLVLFCLQAHKVLIQSSSINSIQDVSVIMSHINSKIQLKMENFRAINSANIDINGISVVSGINGSGKSTISKTLYYVFKTCCDLDKHILRTLRRNLFAPLKSLEYLSDYFPKETNDGTKDLYDILQYLDTPSDPKTINDFIIFKIEDIERSLPPQEKLSTRFKHISKDLLASPTKKLDYVSDYFSALKSHINHLINDAFSDLKKRPISYLKNEIFNVFHSNNLPQTLQVTEDSEVIIDINTSSIGKPFFIQNVIYIDTPMLFGSSNSSSAPYWNDTNQLLKMQGKNQFHSSLINQIISNDILKAEISHDYENLINEISYTRQSDGLKINFEDCATGIKSFGMINLLLKNGIINDKTLLILDEPEAHLHPQWIIEYARILTLINKHIGTKLFIATHNPDMLSALKHIPNKEKTLSIVDFYLAKPSPTNSHMYNFTCLKNDIEPIFESFNISYQKLDQYMEDQ